MLGSRDVVWLYVQEYHVTVTSALDIELQELCKGL